MGRQGFALGMLSRYLPMIAVALCLIELLITRTPLAESPDRSTTIEISAPPASAIMVSPAASPAQLLTQADRYMALRFPDPQAAADGISVLTAAYRLTGDTRYAMQAHAFQSLLVSDAQPRPGDLDAAIGSAP